MAAIIKLDKKNFLKHTRMHAKAACTHAHYIASMSPIQIIKVQLYLWPLPQAKTRSRLWKASNQKAKQRLSSSSLKDFAIKERNNNFKKTEKQPSHFWRHRKYNNYLPTGAVYKSKIQKSYHYISDDTGNITIISHTAESLHIQGGT